MARPPALNINFESDAPATLRVHLFSDELPRVRETGVIIERLGNAFEQYSRFIHPSGRRATLVIDSVKIGSLIADLIAVGPAFLAVWEAREILGGFITHLNDGMAILAGVAEGYVRPATRMAIQAMARPIAKDHAQQVVISVTGSNNTVIVDREAIKVINFAANDARSLPSDLPLSLEEEQQLSIQLAALRSHLSDKISRKIVADASFPLRRLRGPRGIESALPAGEIAQHNYESMSTINRFGTAIRAGGDWFVRIEGFNGALIPASPDTDAFTSIDPDVMKTVYGDIETDNRGFPVEFHIRGVVPDLRA